MSAHRFPQISDQAVNISSNERLDYLTQSIVSIGLQVPQETEKMRNRMLQKLQIFVDEKNRILETCNEFGDPVSSMRRERDNIYASQITSHPVFDIGRSRMEKICHSSQKMFFTNMDAAQRIKQIQIFPGFRAAHRSSHMFMDSLTLEPFSVGMDDTTFKWGVLRFAINENPHEKLPNSYDVSNANGGLGYDVEKFAMEDSWWAQDQERTRRELSARKDLILHAERKLIDVLRNLEMKLYFGEEEKNKMQKEVEHLKDQIMWYNEKKAKFETKYENKVQFSEIENGLIVSSRQFAYDCSLKLQMACFMEDAIGGKLHSFIETSRFCMLHHDLLLPEITKIRIPNPEAEVQVRDGVITSIRIQQSEFRSPIAPLFKVQADLMFLKFDLPMELLNDTIGLVMSLAKEPITQQEMAEFTRRGLPLKVKVPFTDSMSLRIEMVRGRVQREGQYVFTAVICGRPINWREIKRQQRIEYFERRQMEWDEHDRPKSFQVFLNYFGIQFPLE